MSATRGATPAATPADVSRTSRPRAALRLGTRGSLLARAQSESVAAALRALGVAVHLVVVTTEGDTRRPDTAWGEGAFVTALEVALLEGTIDLAVHSAKDLPLRPDPRLVVAAFPPRADPRDALLARVRGWTLASLPPGARVGTDSPRRTGFLRAERRDLRVHPLHGNVDTRIARLESGETDAIVLAVAGLERLGRSDRIDFVLDPAIVPPAPGQGALAVQVRADDAPTIGLVTALDDASTRAAVLAERAFLEASGGGCRAPIGAIAMPDGELLALLGAYVRPDGTGAVRGEQRGRLDRPGELGRMLAARLGPRPDLAAAPTPGATRILVTRAADQADPLLEVLRGQGLTPVAVPAIRIEPAAPGGPLERAVREIGRFDWVVVTSANAATALVAAAKHASMELVATREGGRAPRWAAVGEATASALTEAGIAIAFLPARATGDALGRELPVEPGQRVLLPRAERAGADLPATLQARGAAVTEVVAYRTVEAPAESRALLRDALAGPLRAIVFSSGSTVRGLVELAGGSETPEAELLRQVPVVCVGPSTAAEAAAHGFEHVTQAAAPDPASVARAVVALVADPLLVVS